MDNNEFRNRYISARRNVIALDFAHLNDVQREAAMITQGPLLLLAGAGSGKTTVLINRIANLLKYGSGSDSDYVPETASEEDLLLLEDYIKSYHASQTEPQTTSQTTSQTGSQTELIAGLCAVDPVEPWRIIAITFTNKAAGEMKKRLEAMLGPGSEDIWAMTFHSACARMLRRDIDRLGYDKDFTIYDTADTSSLMRRILKDLNIDDQNFPHKAVLGNISRAKDAMISAEDFMYEAEKAFDSRKKIIGRLYLEYSSRLKASNSLDFDDLILLTVRLLHENPDILDYYRRRFRHVLVDEYQDTNNLQYLLAEALAGGFRNICVVGDDDQSIYKFRGATIENILSFENRYPDAKVIRLEQNYRSTGSILDAANDVIRRNKGRKGKTLWTDNENGEKPSLNVIEDERVEAQFVADCIITSVSTGRNWREHAILYRMNAQSNQFETAFKRSGIPYRVYGGTGFYERAEIKDMLAYLCVLHNPNDNVRLLRILNNPTRGIGSTTEARLAELALEFDKPLYEIIRESKDYPVLKSSSARLSMFADLIDDLRDLTDTVPLDELYDMLISRTGYIRMLEEKGSDENISRIENVRELKTNIIGFMKDSGGTLFDFLSETALYTDLDRDDQSADRVLMMTMHSAKGLEFDTVFIVGAEEGLFPGVRSIGDPAEMEEERRLCYVAMTRAMRRLYFTSTIRRMLFGKTTSSQPSRFTREINPDNLEIHEAQTDFYDYFPSYSPPSDSASFKPPSLPSRPVSQTPYNSQAPYNSSSPSTSHSYSSSLPTSSAHARARFSPSPPSTGVPETRPPDLDLRKGDSIKHKAFGKGLITDISSAGGDSLLEIVFDEAGTKRMLLKSTARYITKI